MRPPKACLGRIAHVAPELLGKGLNDDSIASLKTLMNPALVAMIEPPAAISARWS